MDLNGYGAHHDGVDLGSGPRSRYSWDEPPSAMATRLINLCTMTTWTLTWRARSGTNSVMALPIGSVASEVEMRAALAPKLC